MIATQKCYNQPTPMAKPKRSTTKPTDIPNLHHYRWFAFNGDMLVHGEEVWVATLEGAPIHDLPPGEEGKREIAERVRRYFAEQYNDPHARWKKLHIREVAPEDVGIIEDDPFP